MNILRRSFHCSAAFAVVCFVTVLVYGQQPKTHATPAPANARATTAPAAKAYPPKLVESGRVLFQRDCSFCHGRDASGGEGGPDLTRSRLVAHDANGERIGPVVRNGRPDKGMPPFDRTADQIASLVAFIHSRRQTAVTTKGGRKGVDVSDLQTGNAEAGKRYFEGAGGCSGCHSPTGDLAGIATRYQGLELEEQMLYPKHPKSKVTVTLASGETVSGVLEYLDEFTVGLRDSEGSYRSWRIRDVQYKLDAPVHAHAELFPKYTDDDIHNLMAYIQTLR